MKDYDENKVLTDYIIMYYSHLLSDYDKKILNYHWIRRKRPNGEYDDLLQNFHIQKEDEKKLLPYLEDDNFYQHFNKIVKSLCDKNKNEIDINRCPNCNRITRTNKSKQCNYCGKDWH